MEKYLKTPKKVTTTSTTIKTVVDQDPEGYEIPKAIEQPIVKRGIPKEA